MISFLRGFVFAFNGIRLAWSGRNVRVQCAAALAAISCGLWLEISRNDWMILSIIVALVLAFETLNSAVEEIVNLVSPEYNPLAGKIKDLAAGAVLLMAITSVIVGAFLFYPYLALRFNL